MDSANPCFSLALLTAKTRNLIYDQMIWPVNCTWIVITFTFVIRAAFDISNSLSLWTIQGPLVFWRELRDVQCDRIINEVCLYLRSPSNQKRWAVIITRSCVRVSVTWDCSLLLWWAPVRNGRAVESSNHNPVCNVWLRIRDANIHPTAVFQRPPVSNCDYYTPRDLQRFVASWVQMRVEEILWPCGIVWTVTLT